MNGFDFTNWIDISAIVTLAACVALFFHKRWLGVVIGLGGILLLQPLRILAELNPLLALIAALVMTIIMAFLGLYLNSRNLLDEIIERILGGISGFLFGLVVVLALASSFPVGLNSQGSLLYPDKMPVAVQVAAKNSLLMKIGSDTALYQAYELYNQTSLIKSANVSFIRFLHSLFVEEDPWASGK